MGVTFTGKTLDNLECLILQRKVRSKSGQSRQFRLAMRAISDEIPFLVIAYSLESCLNIKNGCWQNTG